MERLFPIRKMPEINAYDFHSPRDLYGGALNAFERLRAGNPWIREARRIRELWEISNLGVGFSLLTRQPVEVRLSDEEPADGQMKYGGQVVDLQTTVRNREGREPDREYRERNQDLNKVHRIPVVEATEEQAVEWIAQAVASKETKAYSKTKPLYLLVHVNFTKRGLALDELMGKVGELSPVTFDQIWLLTPVISEYEHAYAIARLHPESDGFFAYDTALQKVIDPKELHYPFGPMELRYGKPA